MDDIDAMMAQMKQHVLEDDFEEEEVEDEEERQDRDADEGEDGSGSEGEEEEGDEEEEEEGDEEEEEEESEGEEEGDEEEEAEEEEADGEEADGEEAEEEEADGEEADGEEADGEEADGEEADGEEAEEEEADGEEADGEEAEEEEAEEEEAEAEEEPEEEIEEEIEKEEYNEVPDSEDERPPRTSTEEADEDEDVVQPNTELVDALNASLKDLWHQNEGLEETISFLQKEKDAGFKAIEAEQGLLEEIDSLKSQLADALSSSRVPDNAAGLDEEEKVAFQTEINELKTKLAEAVMTAAPSDAHAEEVKALNEEIVVQTELISTLESENDEMKALVNELQSMDKKSLIKEGFMDNEGEDEIINDEKLTVQEKLIKALEEENSDLKALVEDLQKMNKDDLVHEGFENLEDEEAAEEENNEAENNEAIEKLELEIKVMRDAKFEVEMDVKRRDETIAELKNKNLSLEDKVSVVEARVAELESSLEEEKNKNKSGTAPKPVDAPSSKPVDAPVLKPAPAAPTLTTLETTIEDEKPEIAPRPAKAKPAIPEKKRINVPPPHRASERTPTPIPPTSLGVKSAIDSNESMVEERRRKMRESKAKYEAKAAAAKDANDAMQKSTLSSARVKPKVASGLASRMAVFSGEKKSEESSPQIRRPQPTAARKTWTKDGPSTPKRPAGEPRAHRTPGTPPGGAKKCKGFIEHAFLPGRCRNCRKSKEAHD